MNAYHVTDNASANAQSQANSEGAPSVPLEADVLSNQLGQAIASNASLHDLICHLARIIHEQSDCLGLWFSMPDDSGQCSLFRPVPHRQDDPVWQVVEDQARAIVAESSVTGSQRSTVFQANAQLVVSPVGQPLPDQNFRQFGVWVACFSTESQTAIRQGWLMSMIAQATAAWFTSRDSSSSKSRIQKLNEILSAVVLLGQTDNVERTCLVLCNQLRKHFLAEQVAVSLAEGVDSFRLVAVSDVEQIDHAAEWTKDVAEACACGGRLGTLAQFSQKADGQASGEEPPETHKALENFCLSHQVQGCVSVPLKRTDGSVCASVLIVADAERLQNDATIEQLEKTTQVLGAQVDIVARANQGPRQWLTRKLSQWKSANWTRVALLSAAAVAIVLCLPLPYRISCDCTIQPVKRRFLAAPYDGILDHADVKLGDVVSEGTLLARMDGGNLKIELLGLEADLSAARKKRDTALAQGEVAQSQIARSEMKRHQAKIDLLSEQLKNLEIRSPIDGLIVAGDLDKVEGAPLEMGQTVFEVAPLDRMLVEVAVEQGEVGYVRQEMPVDIKLNAFPFQSWKGTVKCICPSAEIVNDKAVFVAEVEIDNEEMKLKPGMEGTAKIRSDRACLGWSLFHRPWETIRYWTVW